MPNRFPLSENFARRVAYSSLFTPEPCATFFCPTRSTGYPDFSVGPPRPAATPALRRPAASAARCSACNLHFSICNLQFAISPARSPFRPSRPPVFRWHFTASRPRSAESGLCLRLRNSLMHGPFPRMHAGLPLMHAPFPALRRSFAGIRRAFARMNDALAGMRRSLGRLGRSLARCAGRNGASLWATWPAGGQSKSELYTAKMNPNGILSPSPGLRAASYPGKRATIHPFQPQGGCVEYPALTDTTPLGLRSAVGSFPRVGRRSSGQPWARGHNPVGIECRLPPSSLLA